MNESLWNILGQVYSAWKHKRAMARRPKPTSHFVPEPWIGDSMKTWRQNYNAAREQITIDKQLLDITNRLELRLPSPIDLDLSPKAELSRNPSMACLQLTLSVTVTHVRTGKSRVIVKRQFIEDEEKLDQLHYVVSDRDIVEFVDFIKDPIRIMKFYAELGS